MFWIGSVHQVVIDGTVWSAEGVLVGNLAAEVEEGAPGVVEEDAEGSTFAIVDEVRDAFVDGVRRLLPAEGITVPYREGFAGAIERSWFVAQAKEVGVLELLFVNPKSGTVPLDRVIVLL